MHKTRLVFKGSDVRKLLDDSKKATERRQPYVGVVKGLGVGLILVKDDGVYLLSNSKLEKGEAPSQTGLIAYAKGYGSFDTVKNRGAHYEKIREAVGGDDFAEAMQISSSTDMLIQDGMDFIVYLTKDQISIQIRRAA